MPRRAASAPAWLRVETPSLRRTAETWWAAVFSDTKSRPAISALRSPSATSATTSSSRAVSPAGFSRVAARGPRRVSRAPRSRSARGMRRGGAAAPAPRGPAALAERARDAAGGRVRAEALELGQAAPPRIVVVGMAEGEGRLIGAAHRDPPLGGRRPLAGELELEGLGHGVGLEGVHEAGPAAPHVQLAAGPAVDLLEGERRLGLGRDGLVLAGEPARLGAGTGHRGDALHLAHPA